MSIATDPTQIWVCIKLTIPTTRHSGDSRKRPGIGFSCHATAGRGPVEQSGTAVAGDAGGDNSTTLRSPRDPTTVTSASGRLFVDRWGSPEEVAVDPEPER